MPWAFRTSGRPIPDSSRSWRNKGKALYRMGVYNEAIACHNQSLRLDPDCPSTWINKGKALYALGELEEAISCLDRALRLLRRLGAVAAALLLLSVILMGTAEGLIGGFGYSEISPASLRLAAKVAPVAAVQSEYSLWTRLPELGMIQACEELGTAFVPFSPLGRGWCGSIQGPRGFVPP